MGIIDFADILFIAWGFWTPAFEARIGQSLNAKRCLSIVGKRQTLDIEAESEQIAALWVKALRALIGHSDDKSDAMAKQFLESSRLRRRENEKNEMGKENQKALETM